MFTVEDARTQREQVRDAVRRAGRDPDEVKFFVGIMTAIGPTKRAALDRRVALGRDTFPAHVPYLGAMLSLELHPDQLDQPLTPAQLAAAHASPHDPRSPCALEIAREGWTLRDVLAHGVPVGSIIDTRCHEDRGLVSGVGGLPVPAGGTVRAS